MDDPIARWRRSTESLRGIAWDEAEANAWLLDQGRERWASVVMARTSMASLLFTMPGDENPFDREVRVSWWDGVYEFQLQEDRKPVVAADRCFAGNAPVVLDAFLYQLAGAAAPTPGDD